MAVFYLGGMGVGEICFMKIFSWRIFFPHQIFVEPFLKGLTEGVDGGGSLSGVQCRISGLFALVKEYGSELGISGLVLVLVVHQYPDFPSTRCNLCIIIMPLPWETKPKD